MVPLNPKACQHRSDLLAGVLAGLILLALSVVSAASAQSPNPCGLPDPCAVEDGDYFAALPAGWDGKSPLPMVLYFHGWNSSGTAVLKNRTLVQGFTGRGALLIAPNGRRKTWAHGGSPSSARDEIVFVDALMADVRERWPLDETRLWVTGFSQGGSMAWDVACYRGDRFSAFFPISGGFWRPHPEACPAGPVNLRHVHGTSDSVVPMAGRPIGSTWQQGDIEEGMGLWRANNGCQAAPARTEINGAGRCRVWSGCASGKELQLCLHDGGHTRRKGWIDRALDWASEVSATAE